MERQRLAKMIVMGLILSVGGTLQGEAAVFTNGTYNNVQGNYYQYNSDVVGSTGPVFMTATGDTVFETDNGSTGNFVTIRANNGSDVDINMQGHNLTAIGGDDVVIQCANGTPVATTMKIYNVDNLNVIMNVGHDSSNSILCWKGLLDINANKVNVTELATTGSAFPAVLSTNDAVVKLSGRDGVTVNTRGRGFAAGGSASTLNIISSLGEINVTSRESSGARAINDSKLNIDAYKDVNITGATYGVDSTGTNNSTTDITSQTGKITVVGQDANSAGIRSLNNSTITLHSDTLVQSPQNGVQAENNGNVIFEKGGGNCYWQYCYKCSSR